MLIFNILQELHDSQHLAQLLCVMAPSVQYSLGSANQFCYLNVVSRDAVENTSSL